MEKQTYIYGIRAVFEAIEAKETLDKVFIQKGLQGDLIKTLENLIRKQGLNTSYVPIEKLDRLAKQHNNHQGVVASISPIEFHELDPFVESVLETKESAQAPDRSWRSRRVCQHDRRNFSHRRQISRRPPQTFLTLSVRFQREPCSKYPVVLIVQLHIQSSKSQGNH